AGAGGIDNRVRRERWRRHQGYPIAADEEKGPNRPKNHERIPACGPNKSLPRSRGHCTSCFRRVLCRHSLLSTCLCVSSHASQIVCAHRSASVRLPLERYYLQNSRLLWHLIVRHVGCPLYQGCYPPIVHRWSG